MQKVLELINSFSHKAVGQRETLRLIAENKLKLVLLAKNTDSNILCKITSVCQNNNIAIHYVESKSDLGKICQIEVDCCCVGLY